MPEATIVDTPTIHRPLCDRVAPLRKLSTTVLTPTEFMLGVGPSPLLMLAFQKAASCSEVKACATLSGVDSTSLSDISWAKLSAQGFGPDGENTNLVIENVPHSGMALTFMNQAKAGA